MYNINKELSAEEEINEINDKKTIDNKINYHK